MPYCPPICSNPGELPHPDSTTLNSSEPEEERPPRAFPGASLAVLTHSLADPGVGVHAEAGPALALVAAFEVDTELAAGVRLLTLVNVCVFNRDRVFSGGEATGGDRGTKSKRVSSSG